MKELNAWACIIALDVKPSYDPMKGWIVGYGRYRGTGSSLIDAVQNFHDAIVADSEAKKAFDAAKIRIVDVQISTRLRNVIRDVFDKKSLSDITIGDVASIPASEWKYYRRIGKKSFDELLWLVNGHNLKFSDEV